MENKIIIYHDDGKATLFAKVFAVEKAAKAIPIERTLDIRQNPDLWTFEKGKCECICEQHDLYPLLYHSDCDGELTPDECFKISKGLSEIIDKITDSYLIEKTKQFIEGCNLAYSEKEPIEFH